MPSFLCVSSVLVAVVAVLFALASFESALMYNRTFNPADFPDEDPFAGVPADGVDTSVSPFTFSLGEDAVANLRAGLRASPFHPEHPLHVATMASQLPDMPQYGLAYSKLRDAVVHWEAAYDFEAFEAHVNAMPQFTTTVFGRRLHFAHRVVDGDAPTVLMLHGWPGSFLEFHAVVEDAAMAGFNLVVPSMLGYGLSEAPTTAGVDPVAHAQVFAALMKRLGYTSYVVQGGDWGGMIAAVVAQIDPACTALHTNFFPAIPTPRYALFGQWLLSEEDVEKSRYPMPTLGLHGLDITGYMHQQATRPDTTAAAVMASPTALLAWLLEKVEAWSDAATRPPLDAILHDISLYYFTNTIAPSMRLYYDHFHSMRMWSSLLSQVHKPTALLDFPHEMIRIAEPVARAKFTNIASYTTASSGGHFAAWERPAMFACHVAAFVNAQHGTAATAPCPM